MKRQYIFLFFAVTVVLASCTTLQKPAELLAGEYLSDNSFLYISAKPQELDDKGMQNLLSFILPALNKEQKEAIKRIDIIIAGISIANEKPQIEAIIQGDFPSLNLLIKLDKSSNWRQEKNIWYNSQYDVSISEAAPGTFFVQNGKASGFSGQNTKAQADKQAFISFIQYMTEKSLSAGIFSLENFSKAVLKSDSQSMAIKSIYCSLNKTNDTYDFAITFTYPDVKTAQNNMILSRTIMIITLSTMFPGGSGTKIIQKLEWNIDDAGRVTAIYRGLSQSEISTIFSGITAININSLLNN